MEGRFSPGPTAVRGTRVARHASATSAYQTKAHPRRDHSCGSRRRRVSSNVLPAMDPAWENAIRDWLIPLNLDTNHGYAKEPVVISELVKRRNSLQNLLPHLPQLPPEPPKNPLQ